LQKSWIKNHIKFILNRKKNKGNYLMKYKWILLMQKQKRKWFIVIVIEWNKLWDKTELPVAVIKMFSYQKANQNPKISLKTIIKYLF
jgi:hypothetical protein